MMRGAMDGRSAAAARNSLANGDATSGSSALASARTFWMMSGLAAGRVAAGGAFWVNAMIQAASSELENQGIRELPFEGLFWAAGFVVMTPPQVSTNDWCSGATTMHPRCATTEIHSSVTSTKSGTRTGNEYRKMKPKKLGMRTPACSAM